MSSGCTSSRQRYRGVSAQLLHQQHVDSFSSSKSNKMHQLWGQLPGHCALFGLCGEPLYKLCVCPQKNSPDQGPQDFDVWRNSGQRSQRHHSLPVILLGASSRGITFLLKADSMRKKLHHSTKLVGVLSYNTAKVICGRIFYPKFTYLFNICI